MADDTAFPDLDVLVARLVKSTWKERDAIKQEILQAVESHRDRQAAKEHLENARKGLKLEVRWEIDEILEKLAPPPAPPEPEPEPEEVEDPNKPLSAGDLTLVYDDPRGLLLHKTKKGERWFATQRDPRTGQPQTFELHPQEIQQLKVQLKGSPYWVLGAGGAVG